MSVDTSHRTRHSTTPSMPGPVRHRPLLGMVDRELEVPTRPRVRDIPRRLTEAEVYRIGLPAARKYARRRRRIIMDVVAYLEESERPAPRVDVDIPRVISAIIIAGDLRNNGTGHARDGHYGCGKKAVA
jgi:hypothetical protein